MFQRLWILTLPLFFLSCGYGFVTLKDSLPGGYKKVSIPAFKNLSHEFNLENVFTADLKNEFFKSQIIEVVSPEDAKVEIKGTIDGVSFDSISHAEKELPGRATKVFVNEYQGKVDCTVALIRKSDKKILWKKSFSDARQYVTQENLLENEKKQQEAFRKISLYLMEQVHDMMLEDF